MSRFPLSSTGLFAGIVILAASGPAASGDPVPRPDHTNLIENGDFQAGEVGSLPTGWRSAAARPALMPVFRLE